VVRHIIFDLGGVLYDIDFARTTSALSQLGINFTAEDWAVGSQATLLDRFERGELSIDDFIQSLMLQTQPEVSAMAVKQACCALLLGFNKQRLDYLHELRQHYSVYLLSNTNPMHIEVVEAELQTTYGLSGLNDLFIHPFLSYEMGLRKPDKRIYHAVLQQAGLLAAETLFVDDSIDNITAAAACGLQVLHKPADVELCEVLPSHLEIVC
jgi:glucose-1-phosphatase